MHKIESTKGILKYEEHGSAYIMRLNMGVRLRSNTTRSEITIQNMSKLKDGESSDEIMD